MTRRARGGSAAPRPETTMWALGIALAEVRRLEAAAYATLEQAWRNEGAATSSYEIAVERRIALEQAHSDFRPTPQLRLVIDAGAGLQQQPAELVHDTVHEGTWYGGDFFEGTAAALIASGHCIAAEVPGQPDCGKTMMTFAPDGTRVLKGTYKNVMAQPGMRQIKRLAKDFYRVRITVSLEEQLRRAERYAAWAKDKRAAAETSRETETRTDEGKQMSSVRPRQLGTDLYQLVAQRKHLSVVPPAAR